MPGPTPGLRDADARRRPGHPLTGPNLTGPVLLSNGESPARPLVRQETPNRRLGTKTVDPGAMRGQAPPTGRPRLLGTPSPSAALIESADGKSPLSPPALPLPQGGHGPRLPNARDLRRLAGPAHVCKRMAQHSATPNGEIAAAPDSAAAVRRGTLRTTSAPLGPSPSMAVGPADADVGVGTAITVTPDATTWPPARTSTREPGRSSATAAGSAIRTGARTRPPS